MGEPNTDALIGALLVGKLRVLRVLGEGGMGAVYEVEHTMTRHHRALKVLHAGVVNDPEVVTRFLREATVAGTLRSPFVVETFDAGQLDDGSPYVLMEMLEGQTLDDALQSGELTQSRFVEMVREACTGLSAAHAAGIVHRDLKPENIFVSKTHDGERVKLLDFGISKFSRRDDEEEARLTRTGRVLGTPLYMSPEQAIGSSELDARTDIYSLGVILYEGLGGRPPFLAETLPALVIQIHTGDFEPLTSVAPHVDAGLAKVVERAMARLPSDRYQSIEALDEALAPFTAAGRVRRDSFAETLDAPARTLGQTADGGRVETGPMAGQDESMAATAYATADEAALSPTSELSTPAPAPEPPRGRGPVVAGVAVVALLGLGGAYFALGGAPSAAEDEPLEAPAAQARVEPSAVEAPPAEPEVVPIEPTPVDHAPTEAAPQPSAPIADRTAEDAPAEAEPRPEPPPSAERPEREPRGTRRRPGPAVNISAPERSTSGTHVIRDLDI